MTDDDERMAFASRLNEICDDMSVPPKGRGRQTVLKKVVDLSQNAVLKWLEGNGYPSMENARQLAVWADVQIEWLLTGRGPKRLTYSSLPNLDEAVGENDAANAYAAQRALERALADREAELSGQLHELTKLWINLNAEQRAETLSWLRDNIHTATDTPGVPVISHTETMPQSTGPSPASDENPERQRSPDGSVDLWERLKSEKKKTPGGKPGAAK